MSLFDGRTTLQREFGVDLSEPPAGGPITAIVVGIGLALLPILYGIACIIRQEGMLIGNMNDGLVLQGGAATGLGIASIGVGLFIHFHWFWGLMPKLAPFAIVGKAISVLALVIGLGIVFYQFFVVI